MTDIIDRIKSLRYVHVPQASQLFEEAIAEIERLRLTESEREAVRFCVTASLPETEKLGGVAGELCRMHSARLRGLLERLGTTGSEERRSQFANPERIRKDTENG